MSEKGPCVAERKEHVSFECYQKTYQLLIEEGSPDSVFVLYFFDNPMESYIPV